MFHSATEIWIVMQFAVDLCLIGLFVLLIRQLNKPKRKDESEAVEGVTTTIEPVLKEAHAVAKQFEEQLQEKQNLVHQLNERLDGRIISLNLLLNRAEAYLNAEKQEAGKNEECSADVHDLQQEIIKLADKGHQGDNIAKKLGISKGEVNLVLDLKKKFIEMEKA